MPRPATPPAPLPGPKRAPGCRRGLLARAALAGLVALLAACGSAPPRATEPSGPQQPAPAWPAPGQTARALPPAIDPGRDGPGANPPPDLQAVPDAEPRLEPVRSGGPNKPYEMAGQAHSPLTGDPPLLQRGLASWYGRKFHGRSTANGETYNMYAMTAAHKTMPLPSYARVRNPANGREVVVRVNDRGPFHPGRVIDLSYTAALKLGLLGGVGPVEIERITYEAIRQGSWRTPANLASMAGAAGGAAGDAAGGAIGGAAGGAAAGAVDGAAAAARNATPALPPPAAALAAATLPAQPTSLASATTSAITPAITPATTPAQAPALPSTPLPAEAQAAAHDGAPASARSARGFWLQLGAFAHRDGALGFQQRVAREVGWLAPLLAIFDERSLHRLQAGPYASRADARQAADRLREALNLVPALVERR